MNRKKKKKGHPAGRAGPLAAISAGRLATSNRVGEAKGMGGAWEFWEKRRVSMHG